MNLIGHFTNVKRTNGNKADSILKPQGLHKSGQKTTFWQEQNWVNFSTFPSNNTWRDSQRVETTNTVAAFKNSCSMSHLDISMAQYLEPSFHEIDETNIMPLRTPELRLNTDNLRSDQLLLDHDIQNQHKDMENCPPPSQLRPQYTNQQNKKRLRMKQRKNSSNNIKWTNSHIKKLWRLK